MFGDVPTPRGSISMAFAICGASEDCAVGDGMYMRSLEVLDWYIVLAQTPACITCA